MTAFALPVLAAIAYAFTVSRFTGPVDCGELAAVQALAGVAHPTGYPLYTVAGWLFLRVPLFGSKILQLNVLSLVWCVLGLAAFGAALKRILAGWDSAGREGPEAETPHPVLVSLPVWIASGFLAFSRTLWIQAVSTEVYALHFLLSALVMASAVSAAAADPSHGPRTWPWLRTALFLSLSLSNHLTASWLVPGLLVLHFKSWGFRRNSWLCLAACAGTAAAAAGVVYLYLPLRAARSPLLNWGDPRDWASFARHVGGGQYRVWMFASLEGAVGRFRDFLLSLPAEFSWPGAVLGVCGLAVSFVRKSRYAVFLVAVFLANAAYAVNYDIPDLDAYFLLSHAVFALWIGFAVQWAADRLRRPFVSGVFAFSAVQGLLHLYGLNAPSAKAAGDPSVQRYASEALASVPENGLVLTVQWDVLVSPALYLQNVEGLRPGVTVVDKELLRRSWYYRQLARTDPDLAGTIREASGAFVEAVRPFERGGPHDPELLERLYRGVFTGLIANNLDRRPVFLGPELVENELSSGALALPPDAALVPDVFFFRVTRPSGGYEETSADTLALCLPGERDRFQEQIHGNLSRMLARRALYEKASGRPDRADHWRRTLSAFAPDWPLPEPVRRILDSK
jgi:hypothetical protein